MIRFIDLRYQGTQNRFAFWDTVCSCFMRLGDAEAWEDWRDFEEGSRLKPLVDGPDTEDAYFARFKALCPSWVFERPTEDELDFRTTDDDETKTYRDVAEATDSWFSTEARLTRIEASLTKITQMIELSPSSEYELGQPGVSALKCEKCGSTVTGLVNGQCLTCSCRGPVGRRL
jgi:hypothetical protein